MAFPTLEELDAMEGRPPPAPSLPTRFAEGVANSPSNVVTSLMQLMERAGIQPASGQAPTPFDVPPPTNLSEGLTDLAADIPLMMAGGGVGGGIARGIGAGRVLTPILRETAAFAAGGLAHSPEEGLEGAATGAGFGAVSGRSGLTRAALAAGLGGATAVIDKLRGQDTEQALTHGGMNTILSYLLGGRAPRAAEPPPIPPYRPVDRTGQGLFELEGHTRGPRRDGLERWELLANDARSIAEEKARPTIGEQVPFESLAPEGALIENARYTPEQARAIATLQQTKAARQPLLPGMELGPLQDRRVSPLMQMMEGRAPITPHPEFDLAPEGAMIRDARYSEGEALHYARGGRPPVAPEGSMIREPAYSEREALHYARGGPGEGGMGRPPAPPTPPTPPIPPTAPRAPRAPAPPAAPISPRPPSPSSPPERTGPVAEMLKPEPTIPSAAKGSPKFKEVVLLNEEGQVIASGPLASKSHVDLMGTGATKAENDAIMEAILANRNAFRTTAGEVISKEQLKKAGFWTESQEIRKNYPDLIEGLGKKKIAEVATSQVKGGPIAETIQGATERMEAAIKAANAKRTAESEAVISVVSEPSIYHVTTTNNLKGVQKKGVIPLQTSNWKESGTGKRYGGGQIFSFTNKEDAINWARKMDWAQNSEWGSGKIQIVEAKRGKGWEIDLSDPLGQSSKKGDWLKKTGNIPPEDIINVQQFTKEFEEANRTPLPKVATSQLGNPLARKGQEGYIPTIDVIKQAQELVGKDELVRLAGERAKDMREVGTKAIAIERAARLVVSRFKLKEGGKGAFITPELVSTLTKYTAIPALGAVAGYSLDDQHRWGSAIGGAVAAGVLGVFGRRGIAILTKGHPEIKAAKTGTAKLEAISRAGGEDSRNLAKALFADESMARKAAAEWGWSTEYDRLALWIRQNATVNKYATRFLGKAWGVAEDLSEIMRKAVMDLTNMKGIEKHHDNLNAYFEGRMSQYQFSRIPGITKEAVEAASTAMEARTRLQDIVEAGLGVNNLSKKVKASIGEYLTTTYRVFHDPKYRPTDAQIHAAASSLQKQFGGQYEVKLKDIHDFLREIDASRGMFSGKSGGESLSNILHRRVKDITPEYQEMLGIYKNPLERMGFTGIKLVNAARSAEFFNEVARGIKPNGLKFAYTEGEWIGKVASLQNKIKYGTAAEKEAAQLALNDVKNYVRNTSGQNQGRLADLFMDSTMREQLSNYDGAMRLFTNPLVRGLVETTNMIKYGQVILSPLQLVRQVFQMPILGLMARTYPQDWMKAFKTLVMDKSEAGAAELSRLRRLGVLSGDPVGGMFRRDMRAMLDGTLDTILNTRAKKALHTWEEWWRTPDLVIRVASFQKKEADLLSKGMAKELAENAAVDHMNRYTMNYGAVPRIVVQGRQLPFINQYLSFAYEMSRITKNLGQDALNGDVYAMGILSGLATMPFIIQQMAESALSPADKKEWDLVKNAGPAYSRHDFRFHIQRKPNGDFKYINFTPLVLHAPWLSTVRAVMSGDVSGASAVNPVFGWENTPLLNVVTTGITGRNRHSGQQLYSPWDYVNSIRRDVAPILLGTELDRLKDALTRNSEGGLGITNQRTGQSSSIQDLLQTYVTSMRPYTLKPDYVKYQATNEARDRIRQQQITARRVMNSDASEELKQRVSESYNRAVEEILIDYREKLGIHVDPETVQP